MKQVIVYTDGACSGNPGPGGWAAILRSGTHERILTGFEAETTNNRMELRAALQGLAALKGPTRVRVYSDSAYLVNAFIQGWIAKWQRNGWRTSSKKPVENRDLWEALIAEASRHQVEWIKVKGHADNPLNNRVDELAVAAMNDGRQAG